MICMQEKNQTSRVLNQQYLKYLSSSSQEHRQDKPGTLQSNPSWQFNPHPSKCNLLKNPGQQKRNFFAAKKLELKVQLQFRFSKSAGSPLSRTGLQTIHPRARSVEKRWMLLLGHSWMYGVVRRSRFRFKVFQERATEVYRTHTALWQRTSVPSAIRTRFIPGVLTEVII